MKPLRAYSNVLKLRLNLRLRREVIHTYPVMAYIEPTLFCNLRCPACPTGLQLGLRPAAQIDFDYYKAALDELGDYLFELHIYNWGEPLLHRQTPEMVAYAKAKDIHVRLSTNLSIKLSDDTLERLLKSGLDVLVVSLDGASEETYRHYRRRGDYALVRENLRRLREMRDRLRLKTPEIVCQFLVFRHNEHELETVQAEYRNWGADTLVLAGAQMPFPPHDDGFEPSSIPEYNLYQPEHLYQAEGRRQIKGGKPCSWLYGGVVLNPNGQVSPCCSVPDQRDDFGSYAPEEGFQAVWNSERYQQARGLFRKARPAKTAVKATVLEGMGAGVTLERDELICQRCPIPYKQDDVQKTIARAAYRTFRHGLRDPRYLLAFLFMGGMNWAGVQWVIHKYLTRFGHKYEKKYVNYQ